MPLSVSDRKFDLGFLGSTMSFNEAKSTGFTNTLKCQGPQPDLYRATPILDSHIALCNGVSQIKLFLASFLSTFSRDNGGTMSYACASIIL